MFVRKWDEVIKILDKYQIEHPKVKERKYSFLVK
jgi:hypothetical protein